MLWFRILAGFLVCWIPATMSVFDSSPHSTAFLNLATDSASLNVFEPALFSLPAGNSVVLNAVLSNSVAFAVPACNHFVVTLTPIAGSPQMFVSNSSIVSQPTNAATCLLPFCTLAPVNSSSNIQTLSYSNLALSAFNKFIVGVDSNSTNSSFFLSAHVFSCSKRATISPSLLPYQFAQNASLISVVPNQNSSFSPALPVWASSVSLLSASLLGIDSSRVLVLGGHVDISSGQWLMDIVIAPNAKALLSDTDALARSFIAALTTSAAQSSNSMSLSMLIDVTRSVSAPVSAQVFLCPDGSWQSSPLCLSCPSGQYLSGAGCVTCSAGTYSPSLSSRSSCSPCPNGTYSAVIGATACVQCAAGTSSGALAASASGTCSACAVGQFSAATGSSRCVLCSAGSYNALQGSSSCQSCATGTVAPAAGSTACSVCSAGTFSAQSIACASCPAGSISTASQSTCMVCAAGTYADFNGTACVSCSSGQYSNSNATSCSWCPVGTLSVYGNGGCSNCPIGTYSSIVGSTACNTCPSNTYNTVSGSTSCLVMPTTVAPTSSPSSVVAPAPALMASAMVSVYLSTSLDVAQSASFQQSLRVAAANALSVAYSRVLISSVRSGSVVVDYQITPDPMALMSNANVTAAVQSSQSAVVLARSLAAQVSNSSSPFSSGMNTIAPALLDSSVPASVSFVCEDGNAVSDAMFCMCADGQYKQPLTGMCLNCTPGTYRIAPLLDSMCATCTGATFQSTFGATACLQCTESVNANHTACLIEPAERIVPVFFYSLVSLCILFLVAFSCCFCSFCPCHLLCLKLVPCCVHKPAELPSSETARLSSSLPNDSAPLVPFEHSSSLFDLKLSDIRSDRYDQVEMADFDSHEADDVIEI